MATINRLMRLQEQPAQVGAVRVKYDRATDALVLLRFEREDGEGVDVLLTEWQAQNLADMLTEAGI